MAAKARTPFRYSLRTLFGIMAAVAVLSALVRGGPTIVLGIGSFCYGGIIAIPCYAFVGSLTVLSTKTTWGERAGDVFAGLIGAIAWIAFIICALGQWPQLCVVYSLCALTIMGFIVWRGWQVEPGPSPEASLGRLMQAKQDCVAKLRERNSPD
jgi:Na+/proline symporter